MIIHDLSVIWKDKDDGIYIMVEVSKFLLVQILNILKRRKKTLFFQIRWHMPIIPLGRPEGNLWESFFSFHRAGSGSGIEMIRVGGNLPYHLAESDFILNKSPHLSMPSLIQHHMDQRYSDT